MFGTVRGTSGDRVQSTLVSYMALFVIGAGLLFGEVETVGASVSRAMSNASISFADGPRGAVGSTGGASTR